MIINADILEWAASYDGPLFHALLCDPPYHLTEIVKRFGKPGAAAAQPGTDGAFQRSSRGFMGRSWDGGAIAFQPETWAALANLLHPGAFLMAFAGSRGYHRMACAIEDAGLIIHPAIGWVFGCLSDDTEILTRGGWEPYHKATAGTDIMCYNTGQDALEWHAVQELYIYDYDDTAYRIHSDRTDQIVSRNHRCLVKRGGAYVFQLAETLASQETIPILEALPDMRSSVQRRKQRSISQAQDLFSGLCQPDACGSTASSDTQAQGQGYNMRMRHTGVQARRMAPQDQNAVLLALMPRETCDSPYLDGSQIRSHRDEVPRYGIEGRSESRLEGRGDLLQNARQLYQREVCALPDRVHRHGPQRWVCDGASAIRGTSDRAMPVALRSGASYRPQPSQQRPGKFAAVRQQPRSQTVRASRITAPNLATVTPVHYRGVVWCVRVPTGAFVARRNGKIFITGNSGFPKATRIDTQVDRRAGAVRETVGTKKHQPKFAAKDFGYREKDNGYNSRDRESFDVTAPATELAAAWQGHRYGLQAMKPAFEFICVAQKPYDSAPVDCITRTGAGALWIDGGRIPCDDKAKFPVGCECSGYSGGWPASQGDSNPMGRWPANLILSHHPDCEPIGTRRVRGTKGEADYTKTGVQGPVSIIANVKTGRHYADADGMETITAWRCVESCPVRRLGEQSGESEYPRHSTKRSATKDIDGMQYNGGYSGQENVEVGFSDRGTAARFFFQADYMYERLEAADPLFYCAKADRAEREAGLDPRQVALLGMEGVEVQESSPIYSNEIPEGAAARGRKPRHGFDQATINDGRQKPIDNPYQRGETMRRNTHPCQKPLSLTRYLATLLLPPAMYAPRRLLVPFSGAASEYIGALLAGWDEIVGIELEADYCRIAEARAAYWTQRRYEFLDPSKPIAVKLDAAPDGQMDMFMDQPAYMPLDEWLTKTAAYGGTAEEWRRIYGEEAP